jgi:hypothetical protein
MDILSRHRSGGIDMEVYKPLLSKQHEARNQERRQERDIEDERLHKLKMGLLQKMQAISPNQTRPTNAA